MLLVEKYRRCGFSKVWFASAFKGATGVNQSLTLIGHHLQNHLQWLKVASSTPTDVLQGIALTGWQRYVVAFLMVSRIMWKQTSTQKLFKRHKEVGHLQRSFATLQSFLLVILSCVKAAKRGFQNSSQLLQASEAETACWHPLTVADWI